MFQNFMGVHETSLPPRSASVYSRDGKNVLAELKLVGTQERIVGTAQSEILASVADVGSCDYHQQVLLSIAYNIYQLDRTCSIYSLVEGIRRY